MNMQDYRHAADRVHIAEHCEEEVLSMTTQTEQKTRRPLLRTATGIAAAAACLGITGALGFALYRMGHEESSLLAASQNDTAAFTELTDADSSEAAPENSGEIYDETYEDFLAAYYEKTTGYPVNYDWSSLCGTNLNEVWETAGGTVTLKAAVTDGYQLYYYYTFKPNFDWNSVNWDEGLDEEITELMPNLQLDPADFQLLKKIRYGDGPQIRLDDTLREDGTVRFYRFFGSEMTGVPLPETGEFEVYIGEKCEADSRYITVNMPEQMPEWHELSSPLHVVNDGTDQSFGCMEAEYRYALVTPLGAILTENTLDERLEILEQKNDNGGRGLPVMGNALSVMKLTTSGGKANAPHALFGSFGDWSPMCSLDMVAVNHDPDERRIFSVCTLRFRVPQDLSDAVGMEFTSSAQDEPATVDLTPEKLPFTPELDPDKAEINVVSTPAETAAPDPTATTANAVQIPAETKITAQKPAGLGEEQGSLAYEIVYRLSMLEWSPDTCDGLPEYQWTGLDGNLYYFNLSSGWAWRNTPGTTTGTRIMKEAQLTKEIIALLNAYMEQYGLDECEY